MYRNLWDQNPDLMHLLHQPVEVHWAGWRSTTIELHRRGWEFSIAADPMRMAMEVSIRHPKGGVHGYGHMSERSFRGYNHRQSNLIPPLSVALGFELAKDIVFQRYDALPSFVPSVPTRPWDDIGANEIRVAMEHYRMSDPRLAFFRPLPPETEDVKVIPPTFEEILDMALHSQEEKQKELRAKMRRRERKESGLIITCAA